MKNTFKTVLFGKNAAISAVLAIGIFFVMGFACGGSSATDAKPPGPEYVGAWAAKDGSTITIRSDGGADYKIGGSSVSGGKAEVSEKDKTLKIGLLGMGSPMKVDKAPQNGEMTIDGIVYKKGGGSDTTTDKTTSSSSDDKSTGDAPSKSETEKAIKGTFADFTDAVETGDFTDFYENSSDDFQASYTKDQVKTTFNVFVENKAKATPSLNDVQGSSATFSNGPSIEMEKGIKIMIADGEFSSKPNAVKFETKYEWQKGEWKMLKFKVKM